MSSPPRSPSQPQRTETTVDIEVNSVAAAVAAPNLSVVENQAENSPSIMPTTEPQTTNLATVEGPNPNKKRKTRKAPTNENEDSNGGDPGKRKPCRQITRNRRRMIIHQRERELSARRSKDKGKQVDNSTPPYPSFAAVFQGTNDNEAGPSRTSVMEQLETPAIIQGTQNATNAITAAGHENFANVNGEGNMARVWNGLKALMTEEITLPRLWYKNKYYVFLSIRSEPPSCGVGDAFFRLYLCDRKINTYKDDDTKEWNHENVPQELNRALTQSKIIIIFFTEFYADSPSCLELLAYIIDQFPERYFNIIPVFNGVDRADLELQTQTGKYAKAFRKHYRHYPKEIVDKWKESLRKVAILPSWKMKHRDRTESKVLPTILNAVSKKVDRMVIDDSGFAAFYNGITRFTTTITAAFSYISPPYQRLERDRNRDLAPMRVPLRNGDYMVGLDARLKEVLSCLRFEPDRVLFVGIYGKAGIGKITIARETFNMIAEHFDDDSCCFVPNVGNNSRKYELVALQDKLLSELTTGVTYKKINNVTQGCLAIYNKLHTRKVLILLHDVDAAEQLKALAERANCFGPGRVRFTGYL